MYTECGAYVFLENFITNTSMFLTVSMPTCPGFYPKGLLQGPVETVSNFKSS